MEGPPDENFSGNKDIRYWARIAGLLKLKGFDFENEVTISQWTGLSSRWRFDRVWKQYALAWLEEAMRLTPDKLKYNSKSQTYFDDNLRLFPSKAIQSKDLNWSQIYLVWHSKALDLPIPFLFDN